MTPTSRICVSFREFDIHGYCIADIVLPLSGSRISGFVVKPELGGGILVHMPSWMHNRWSYTEVQWSEVCRIITREYLSVVSAKKLSIDSITNSKKGKYCTFYSSIVREEADIAVKISSANEQIEGIHLVHTKGTDNIQVFMPRKMNNNWSNAYIEWDKLAEIVTNEYRRQVLGENVDVISNIVEIQIRQIKEAVSCMVDVKLPHKVNAIKGFRIREEKGDEKLIVSTPKWMERWKDNKLSWNDLCSFITSEYRKYIQDSCEKTAISPETTLPVVLDESNEEREAKPTKEKDEFGRIKNAENSSLIFYPRTVLRSVNPIANNDDYLKKRLNGLVDALNKGSRGGIGPFEINILEWIAKLRYVKSTMLIDLIKAGCVFYGWRNNVTLSKLTKILNRMAYYGLITLTRFVTVNDKGEYANDNHSNMRIITLGRNGSTFLRELGKNTSKYNPYDIFQDGNTVKRYLSANQWLVYWLKTYTDEIGEEYEPSCVVHLKGAKYTGAKIYATVTINDCTMIAEPVRRVEEFEIESTKQKLREKLERFSLMFDNLDLLYHGKDEISFPQRPIIVFICEDDEHIHEVWETVKPILPKIGNQEIWFSNDRRIFNYNTKGERFLRFYNETLHAVNLKQVLGIDNEEEDVMPMTEERKSWLNPEFCVNAKQRIIESID